MKKIFIFGYMSKINFLLLIIVFFIPKYYGQNLDTTLQSDPAINHCISVVEDVESKGNIIGQLNLDSLGQLPIGIAKDIGSYQVIIAIDSSSFYPNKATFNAYAAIDFPGSADKIAFRAQNIEFNPKGIIGGDMARLIFSEQSSHSH